MRWTPLAAAWLMAALALAGCSTGDGTPDGSPTGSGTGTSPTGAGGPTGTPPPSTGTSPNPLSNPGGANAAPSATLSAAPRAGKAPLRVNFTIAATDLDGDNMTYALSFGDGTANATGAIPATTVAHNYTALGNHTARLTVSDGRNATQVEVRINVTLAAPPQAQPQAVSGTYQSGSMGACNAGLGGPGGTAAGLESGVTMVTANLNPGLDGHPFTAEYTFTVQAAGLVILFPNGGGGYAGVVNNSPSPGSTTLSGTVPAGAVSVQISSCGGAGASVEMEIS